MKKKPAARRKKSVGALERASQNRALQAYELKLFITGSTPKSLEAIARIKALCESELRGRYTLEVIDVHQNPHLAEAEQIVALPTLLRKLPPPLRKILGGFSEKERVLAALGLEPAKQKP